MVSSKSNIVFGLHETNVRELRPIVHKIRITQHSNSRIQLYHNYTAMLVLGHMGISWQLHVIICILRKQPGYPY